MLKRAARDEQGSELVETAITMLVLLMLIFGLIEACWAVYSFHYVANAAHEATRYAIVRGGGWGSSCSGYGSSQCTASPSDVAHYVASRNFPGVNITADEVYVSYFPSVPSSVSAPCPGSTGASTYNFTGNIVQVTICYPFTMSLPGLPDKAFTISSTSQMVIAE